MNIGEIEHRLRAEFLDPEIGRACCPLLFKTGLHDAAVHAAGVSYLLSLGLALGFSAIAEYPIMVHAVAPWNDVGRVFPDSVWFHPETSLPWAVFEFERFERGDETKVRGKAQNLVLSHHQSGQHVELCVLLYWLRSSLAPKSMAPIVDPFRQGFTRAGVSIPPPKCRWLIYKCVVCELDTAGEFAERSTLRSSRAEYVTARRSAGRLVLTEMRGIGL